MENIKEGENVFLFGRNLFKTEDWEIIYLKGKL